MPNVIDKQTFNLYRKIVAGDIDNDGDIDFVGFIAEDAGSNIVNPHDMPAGGIDIWRNDKGTFKLEHVVPLGVGHNFFFHTGVLADINHDGWIDIIAGGQSIRIFLNDGTGHFKNEFFEAGFVTGPGEFDFHGETGVYELEAADLNNDGYLDLLAWSANHNGNPGKSAIELYENNKDGTFKNITDSLFDKGENEFLAVGNWFKIWTLIKMVRKRYYLRWSQTTQIISMVGKKSMANM